MFLIDVIKNNVEKKFIFLFFLRDCESLAYKINPVFFCVMFSGGNKNFFQNKQEKVISIESV